MIDHLKKGDMAREAERLLEDAGWLLEPMRTPILEAASPPEAANDGDAAELPTFLDDENEGSNANAEDLPVAAE